jgi:hypothetical protein
MKPRTDRSEHVPCAVDVAAVDASLRQDSVRDEEDYAAMRMRYGFKSLKPLILAVGVFEIIEETTASGGTRISYRRRTPQASG